MNGGTPIRGRRPLLAVALGLLAALAVAALMAPRSTLHAWYAATLFWTGIPLGGLALLMIHHLTSGRWGWHLRPLLQASAATLPVILLAYLPLLLAMEALFPWTEPLDTLPEVVRNKLAYLNVPFFAARAAVYAAVWLGLVYLLAPRRHRPFERRLGLAAVGLIFYGLTITFYGVDWVHSLEPTFYSSAIGYVMGTGQFVAALAAAILMAALLPPGRDEHGHEAEAAPFHDLGNLLLAAVMLWTYIVFAEYLIIWITDLPHEIEWYLRRQTGAWFWLTIVLVTLHFCVPFVLLLFRRVKQSRRLLAAVAAVLLVASVLNVFWLVLPSFDARPAYAGLIDVLAVAGLGALWLLFFLSRLEAAVHERSA